MEKELFFINDDTSNNWTTKDHLKIKVWRLFNNTLFRWSPSSMHGFRCWLLRAFGAKIIGDCRVANTVKIFAPWKLSLGYHVHIDDYVILRSSIGIYIEDYVCLSIGSSIINGGHDVESRALSYVGKETHIGAGTFVGAKSIIRGVNIGTFACIGLGSLVIKDVPENTIVIGWPAKPYKNRINPKEFIKYRYTKD